VLTRFGYVVFNWLQFVVSLVLMYEPVTDVFFTHVVSHAGVAPFALCAR
jgi:hypothetical protein